MKSQIIARIAIFFGIAVWAIAMSACTPTKPTPTPTATAATEARFSLTLDTLSGDRYIMDTGLTLEDCSDAMMNEPGRGWGCQRETADTAL